MKDENLVNLILETCDELSEHLNKNIMQSFVKLHNIDPKYNKLYLKQEVIARRSLFFKTKKRYILHIINREGDPRDELDIKGISYRRSETPSFTKESVMKLLDLILKKEKVSIPEILDFVNKTNDEMVKLIQTGDKSIAKSIEYKDISEYKNNKRPTHIMGADIWNQFEYQYFVAGTRGYLFYIKGVDMNIAPEKIRKNISLLTNKNNNIVLPYEEPKLPNYYIIDTDKMLEYAWTKRYKELLEPISDKFEKYETLHRFRDY